LSAVSILITKHHLPRGAVIIPRLVIIL
jgi:hypothetical protein